MKFRSEFLRDLDPRSGCSKFIFCACCVDLCGWIGAENWKLLLARKTLCVQYILWIAAPKWTSSKNWCEAVIYRRTEAVGHICMCRWILLEMIQYVTPCDRFCYKTIKQASKDRQKELANLIQRIYPANRSSTPTNNYLSILQHKITTTCDLQFTHKASSRSHQSTALWSSRSQQSPRRMPDVQSQRGHSSLLILGGWAVASLYVQQHLAIRDIPSAIGNTVKLLSAPPPVWELGRPTEKHTHPCTIYFFKDINTNAKHSSKVTVTVYVIYYTAYLTLAVPATRGLCCECA